ncbi:NAD/NADP octopine/nopaline dehydrogenase family protein, partial [Candidatus Sumerlaeota bacterium]|nr:NAD/NADP octopine/nopaline dehydrogenase family protein [Candidatus Sumerlaeota bacterium]
MQIHELIVEKAVCPSISASDKDGALAELVDSLVQAGRLSGKETALRDLISRERSGSSGIGMGIGIPHSCTSAVHQPMIAFGKSPRGIPFQSIDQEPVHFIFLILSPVNGDGIQLKILGRLARLFNNPGFLRTLREKNAPAEIVAFIRQEEANLGEIELPGGLPSVCVVGAGNGGLAMAGHLTLVGCHVHIFNRSPERLKAIQLSGGIQLTGEVNGFAKPEVITNDPEEALSGMDIIMVVVPATGHREIAELLGKHIKEGQLIVLNPGAMGGALEFAEILRRMNIPPYYFLAEAETLIYACRITNPGQARIFRIKNAVPVATFPAYHITDVLATLRKALPYFIPGDNVLKTSLSNISAVFHPALMILNTSWIEQRKGNFEFYLEGASASAARILEALDKERVKVAEALGARVLTAREWLYQAYGVAGDNLHEAMQANTGYRGIHAPHTLDHRYVTEDVP